jgi:hypothetical protein
MQYNSADKQRTRPKSPYAAALQKAQWGILPARSFLRQLDKGKQCTPCNANRQKLHIKPLGSQTVFVRSEQK